MHPITKTVLRHLELAPALLRSFDAVEAMESPLFTTTSDGRLLELTDAGRAEAESILATLAPLAVEAHGLSGDLPGDLPEEFQLAHTIQHALQLIVAGVSGALAGPLPAGEAMNSVYQFAEGQAESLRIRALRLSPGEAA